MYSRDIANKYINECIALSVCLYAVFGPNILLSVREVCGRRIREKENEHDSFRHNVTPMIIFFFIEQQSRVRLSLCPEFSSVFHANLR